jgi:four helix bundle protein
MEREYGEQTSLLTLHTPYLFLAFLTLFFMFEFEKLTVYQKAKLFDQTVLSFVYGNASIDKVITNQLKRAALSIALNIAEGTGRSSKADRRNFYVIARGSAFECAAIFDILKDRKNIDSDVYDDFYKKAEELSMMLYAMIKRLI